MTDFRAVKEVAGDGVASPRLAAIQEMYEEAKARIASGVEPLTPGGGPGLAPSVAGQSRRRRWLTLRVPRPRATG